MRKIFAILLWLLLFSISPLHVWCQEAYVVYSKDKTNLTFYYDNNKESRRDNAFAIYTLEQYSPFRLVKEDEIEYFYEDGNPVEWCWDILLEEDGEYNDPYFVLENRRNKITSVMFDTSFANARPTSCYNWFNSLYSIKSIQGLDNLNTSEVTDMNGMFCYCDSIKNLNLSTFDTSKVTDMSQMFSGCSSLKSLDLSNFNTSKVLYMYSMFSGCSSLKSLDLSSFNTSTLYSMSYMFSNCSSLTTLDLSNFSNTNLSNMSSLFYNCKNLTSINFAGFGTSKVTNMSQMFSGCSNLVSIDLSNFRTYKLRQMSGMFSGCSKLASLDLSKFNISSVTSMEKLFYNCSSLTKLDLSSFNTSYVRNMSDMFNGDISLKELRIDRLNTSNVTNMQNMFLNCLSLQSLDLSNFNMSKVTNSSYMISGCIGINNLVLSQSMDGIANNALSGIGTSENPCNIFVPEGFDFGVGTNSDYFFWKGGCFKLNDGTPNIIYCTDLSLYDDVIYVDNLTTSKGSQACLSVKMNNVTAVRGFQFDLVLPEGVSVATDDEGNLLVELSTERTTAKKMNIFDSAMQDNGALRVLCNSTGAYTFDGNSGEICTIIVDVAPNILAGDHALTLQNIIYTDEQAKKYEVGDDIISKMTVTSIIEGDANGDGVVDVVDVALLANYVIGRDTQNIVLDAVDINGDGIYDVSDISCIINIIISGKANLMSKARANNISSVDMAIQDASVCAGDVVDLPIILNNNSVSISSWQADLILPQGMHVVDVMLDDARLNDHVIDWETNEEGQVRLLCFSMTNKPVEGQNGIVAHITIKTDKNLNPGIYNMQLNNVVMASNLNRLTDDNVAAVLIVNSPTNINELNRNSTSEVEIYGVNGSRIINGQNGIRIVRDKYGNVRKESVK